MLKIQILNSTTMPKFTFKKDAPTGQYSWLYKASYDIKYKKVVVGSINETDDHKFICRFMIMKDDILEDGNNNCPWKWIQLKKQSDSVNEAIDFLQDNIDPLLLKYTFVSE